MFIHAVKKALQLSLLLPITMAKRDRITRLGKAKDHVNVNKDNNVKN